MHWSTCCRKACVSTPDGRGHSWPPSAVGKVYREFALDHSMCHAFLYACTQIFCRLSNSLCDHSMRAAENRKTPIPFCAKSSAESSGVSGWLLIRSRATLAFHVLPVLWRSCHHSPCPSNLGTGTRHWCLAFWDVRHLSSDLVPACFPFTFDPCQLRARKFFLRWSPWNTMLWTPAPRLGKNWAVRQTWMSHVTYMYRDRRWEKGQEGEKEKMKRRRDRKKTKERERERKRARARER